MTEENKVVAKEPNESTRSINVWKILDLKEISTNNDNTTKNVNVRISIQDVPNEKIRHEEVIEFMVKNFLPYEAMNCAIGITNDPDSVNDHRMLWGRCLSIGVSVGAYKLGDSGELLELIGVNILYISTPETDKQIGNCVRKFKSKKLCAMFKIMHIVDQAAEAEFQKISKGEPYIAALGLSINKKFQGQKLGVELLKAREQIADKFNVALSKTFFTSLPSQIQAERAGYKTIYQVDYKDFSDETGDPIFPGITTKTLKVMAKRFA